MFNCDEGYPSMKTALFAMASALVLSMAGAMPAAAFHPADETYGYVMPEKIRKQRGEVIPEPSITGRARELNAEEAAPTDVRSDRRSGRNARGHQSGGGRPEVSKVAPPTVSFSGKYAAGSIVIDTAGRSLYYVKGDGQAYRYPIAVGRKGFTWSGTKTVSSVASWPDWNPPAEMRRRQPELPKRMAGGAKNPLGAKALYLGSSLYRIHGTNDEKSIGSAASSGCFRMTNGHVTHLASLAGVGTKVHVLKKLPTKVAMATAPSGN